MPLQHARLQLPAWKLDSRRCTHVTNRGCPSSLPLTAPSDPGKSQIIVWADLVAVSTSATATTLVLFLSLPTMHTL